VFFSFPCPHFSQFQCLKFERAAAGKKGAAPRRRAIPLRGATSLSRNITRRALWKAVWRRMAGNCCRADPGHRRLSPLGALFADGWLSWEADRAGMADAGTKAQTSAHRGRSRTRILGRDRVETGRKHPDCRVLYGFRPPPETWKSRASLPAGRGRLFLTPGGDVQKDRISGRRLRPGAGAGYKLAW